MGLLFVVLTSLILNQQSKIIYLSKKSRYFNFSDMLSEYINGNFDIRGDPFVKNEMKRIIF